MKHRHVFITAGRVIDDSTRIQLLWVGTSKQDTRDYLFLVAEAANRGYYFERLTADVIAFVEKVALSVGINRQIIYAQTVDIHPFVQLYKKQFSTCPRLIRK